MMFGVIMALEFITLMDYRLHPLAWILPAVLLIGGKHDLRSINKEETKND